MKHEASRPRPPLPKPRLFLLFDHVIETNAKPGESFAGLVNDSEIKEVVSQVWACQEFCGEIDHHTRFLFAAHLHGSSALLVYAIANCERQRCVNVVGRCRHRYSSEGAKEIIDERLPEVGNAHAGSDTDTVRKFTRS